MAVLVVHHEHRRCPGRLRVPDLLRELTRAREVVAHGAAVDQHHKVGRAAHLAGGIPAGRRRRREAERRRGFAVGTAGVVARRLALVGVAVVRVDVDQLAADVEGRGGGAWKRDRDRETERGGGEGKGGECRGLSSRGLKVDERLDWEKKTARRPCRGISPCLSFLFLPASKPVNISTGSKCRDGFAAFGARERRAAEKARRNEGEGCSEGKRKPAVHQKGATTRRRASLERFLLFLSSSS